MITLVNERRRHGEYLIRAGSEEDGEEFIGLRSEVFGAWDESTAADAFRWKYVDNPYIEEVPLVVAERDGTIVGTYGYFVLAMSLDGEPVVGLQGTDAIVHPDHRRGGLFTAMLRFGYDQYRSAYPLLRYGFTLPDAREILLEKGMRHSEVETEVFFHPNDDDWVRYHGSGIEITALIRAAQLPLYRIGMGSVKLGSAIVDSVTSVSRPDITVTKHEDPSVNDLRSLYERAVPAGIHTRRDEQFYDYRLSDPTFRFTTYVARTGDRARAAVTTSRDTKTGTELLVREMLPFEGEARALRAALSSALADRPSGCSAKVWCPTGRRWPLFRSGFVPMSVVPFTSERRSNPLVRSSGPGGDEHAETAIEIPDRWALQAIERVF